MLNFVTSILELYNDGYTVTIPTKSGVINLTEEIFKIKDTLFLKSSLNDNLEDKLLEYSSLKGLDELVSEYLSKVEAIVREWSDPYKLLRKAVSQESINLDLKIMQLKRIKRKLKIEIRRRVTVDDLLDQSTTDVIITGEYGEVKLKIGKKHILNRKKVDRFKLEIYEEVRYIDLSLEVFSEEFASPRDNPVLNAFMDTILCLRRDRDKNKKEKISYTCDVKYYGTHTHSIYSSHPFLIDIFSTDLESRFYSMLTSAINTDPKIAQYIAKALLNRKDFLEYLVNRAKERNRDARSLLTHLLETLKNHNMPEYELLQQFLEGKLAYRYTQTRKEYLLEDIFNLVLEFPILDGQIIKINPLFPFIRMEDKLAVIASLAIHRAVSRWKNNPFSNLGLGFWLAYVKAVLEKDEKFKKYKEGIVSLKQLQENLENNMDTVSIGVDDLSAMYRRILNLFERESKNNTLDRERFYGYVRKVLQVNNQQFKKLQEQPFSREIVDNPYIHPTIIYVKNREIRALSLERLRYSKLEDFVVVYNELKNATLPVDADLNNPKMAIALYVSHIFTSKKNLIEKLDHLA